MGVTASLKLRLHHIQSHQSSIFTPIQAPSHQSRLHHIQSYSLQSRLHHIQSHPGSITSIQAPSHPVLFTPIQAPSHPVPSRLHHINPGSITSSPIHSNPGSITSSPIQAPSHQSRLHHIQSYSLQSRLHHIQSHPGSIMELFLEWDRTSPWAMTLITLLGIASSLRMAFGLLQNLRDLILAYLLPRIWPVDLVKTYGKWAVVTGCTGGIGKSYVLGLAAKGMDIVLVGRSMEKLQALEAELQRKYRCRVVIIQADFTDVSVLPLIVSRLKEEQVE